MAVVKGAFGHLVLPSASSTILLDLTLEEVCDLAFLVSDPHCAVTLLYV